jgi:hypothetical protein
MVSLFGVIRNKYKSELMMYEQFFLVCACLINYHLKKNPLKSDNRGFYKGVMQKKLDKALEKIQKEKESKEKYNAKIRARKDNETLTWMFVISSED